RRIEAACFFAQKSPARRTAPGKPLHIVFCCGRREILPAESLFWNSRRARSSGKKTVTRIKSVDSRKMAELRHRTDLIIILQFVTEISAAQHHANRGKCLS